MRPPLKLLAAALSIIVCLGALAANGAAASAPLASSASYHARSHHAACPPPRHRGAHGCKAATRRHARLKVRTFARTRPATAALRPAAAAAAEQSAALASALSAPCADTELAPEEGNIALVRSAVMCLINRERAQHGVAPLTLNPKLEGAAEGHCSELIAQDYFAHISPGGETPVDRIAATGYIPGPSVGYVIGENLAWGTYTLSTAQAIVSAWIASPGHLANILEAKYTETGIGVIPAVPASLGAGAPGATYAQEFGVIIH